jgi:hypothetical protein
MYLLLNVFVKYFFVNNNMNKLKSFIMYLFVIFLLFIFHVVKYFIYLWNILHFNKCIFVYENNISSMYIYLYVFYLFIWYFIQNRIKFI